MKIARTIALPLGVLFAGGPAMAADTVRMAPEPEPAEYVRICDVYGAGFFYIPGTETCLRISGYVRYTMGATSDDGVDDTPNWYGFEPDQWNKEVRARLNFDARQETEWGMLRSYIRVQSSESDFASDPDVGLDLAYMQLGGLAMGYMQSAFAGTFNGGDSNDGSHSDDGLDFGDQYRQIVQYNFGAGGFFGTLSLEHDDYDNTGNYMPDVVGKAGYTAGFGTVHAALGYDESDESFAARAGLHLDIPNTQASIRTLGLYSDSPLNAYWATSEWSGMVSVGNQFSPLVFASTGFQYWSDLNDGFGFVSGRDQYAVEGSLVLTPVDNLEIRAEANYVKADGFDGSVGGYLWFLRSF